MVEQEQNCRHQLLFIDLLRTLLKVEDQESAIHAVMDMIAGTFQPKRICFVPEDIDRNRPLGDCGPWTNEVRLLPDQMVKLLPSKKGFALGLRSQGRRIGILLVDEVSQPRELNGLMPLVIIIPDALEMAFSNIRHLQDLQAARTKLSQLSESLGVANKVLRHDIANELLVINSSLDLYRLNGKEKDLLRAQTSTLRMQSIISKMRELDSFLLSRSEMEPTGLKKVIDTVLSSMDILYTVEGDAQVLADPALSAIITNLVSNAKKHGKAQHIEFKVKGEGDMTSLTVRDDGVGIPEEHMSRIFQEGIAFGEFRGSGLGLYLIKRTMERYGGSISASNDRRGGARFELTFQSANP